MRSRLFVITALAGIAAVGLATPAPALVLEKKRSNDGLFLLEGCGDTDRWSVWTVENRPFDFRPIRPLLGAPLYDYTFDVVGRITDISVNKRGDELVWTATGTDALCANPDFYGTSLTEELRFSMAFKYHRRIRTYEAEHRLRKALDRRFPFWRSGFRKRAECHGHEPRWRCRIRFAGGDVSFAGKGKVKVREKGNRPQFRVRYLLRQVDHYCIAVRERSRSACTKKIRGRAKF